MKHLLVILIVLISQTLPAKNYYINSKTGQNVNPGVTPSLPFRDFSELENIELNPGDTLFFARGTAYSGFFTIRQSGTHEDPIVLTSYGKGENPVFSNHGKHYILGLEGDYAEVNGLDFNDAHQAGIQIKGNHNSVKNCNITNTGIGISLHGKYSRIFRNNIHHLHIVKSTEGGDDDYGAIGILVGAGNQEIAYNTIDSCIDKSLDYGVDGGGFEFYGDADSVSIHHNYIAHSDGVFEFGAGLISNVSFFYNVFVNNGELGGFHFRGKFSATIKNILVANNTVVDTVKDQYQMIWFNGTGLEQEFRLVNNILYFAGVQRFCNTGSFNHSNNLYYSPLADPVGFSLNASELQAKPKFRNLKDGDFHLKKNSPAIDKGTELNYHVDFENYPIDKQPDLGAFEYH